MIDIKLIRENRDLVKENIKKKFQDEKLPIVDEVYELERTNNINEYAKKLSRITDEKTRLEIAELLADGKTFEAMEKQNEYQANNEAQLRETIRQELLSSNPTPPPVNNTGTTTKEQFAQMGYQEKVKLYNENPELYNQLNS